MVGKSARLWTIVLAAGGSSRLGRPKQLLRVRHRPLIGRVVELAQHLTPDRVVVVVGAERLRLRAIVRGCRGRTTVVTNARWRRGMSGSLRRGLMATPRRANAALLLTVDQPFVGARHLRRLIDSWARYPQRAAAAHYAGRLGVPAILPRRLWATLRGARGDVGAREILRGRGSRVTRVEIPEAAVDIDTEDDLIHLARRCTEIKP